MEGQTISETVKNKLAKFISEEVKIRAEIDGMFLRAKYLNSQNIYPEIGRHLEIGEYYGHTVEVYLR